MCWGIWVKGGGGLCVDSRLCWGDWGKGGVGDCVLAELGKGLVGIVCWWNWVKAELGDCVLTADCVGGIWVMNGKGRGGSAKIV